MELLYILYFAIIGLVFGSFFNVVGYRLPNNESVISPPSHCPKCNHRLTVLELIPVISYIIQLGKCKKCRTKISFFYPFFELLTACLFVISYLIFGLTIDLGIALVFSSVLIIVIISDYKYMIIPDEVLIVGGILITVLLCIKDISAVPMHLLGALSCFATMFLIKVLGDSIFKKESLGGGDIKLMAVIGLTLGLIPGLFNIFFAPFIALPIALMILILKKDNMIPYGPFLSVAALIIYFCNINQEVIIDFLKSFSVL